MSANVPQVVRLQKYLIALSQSVRLQRYLRERPRPADIRANPRAPWLPPSWSAAWSAWRGNRHQRPASPLMALAWHLGSQSYQAGNPGYSGSEQARPAFAVLAVVAATGATIAMAGC